MVKIPDILTPALIDRLKNLYANNKRPDKTFSEFASTIKDTACEVEEAYDLEQEFQRTKCTHPKHTREQTNLSKGRLKLFKQIEEHTCPEHPYYPDMCYFFGEDATDRAHRKAKNRGAISIGNIPLWKWHLCGAIYEICEEYGLMFSTTDKSQAWRILIIICEALDIPLKPTTPRKILALHKKRLKQNIL